LEDGLSLGLEGLSVDTGIASTNFPGTSLNTDRGSFDFRKISLQLGRMSFDFEEESTEMTAGSLTGGGFSLDLEMALSRSGQTDSLNIRNLLNTSSSGSRSKERTREVSLLLPCGRLWG
jgi:hypothetical protein